MKVPLALLAFVAAHAFVQFTAFGSIIALALIGVVAAAPPKEAGSNPAQPNSPGTTSTQPKTDPSPAVRIHSSCP